MIGNISKHQPPAADGKAEVLLGIVMLAVVNAMWQRDSTGYPNEIGKVTKDIFAVDNDIINFYSRPASNTNYLEIPGLLAASPANAAQSVARIGNAELLSQIMGHYVFLGSEHLGAKLVFPSTRREIDKSVDLVKDKAFNEINTSHQGMLDSQKKLTRQVEGYFSRGGATAQGFIERFSKEMEQLYPAIFSEGAVRELNRFGKLFDVDQRCLIYPSELFELNKASIELQVEKDATKDSVHATNFAIAAASRRIGMLPWQDIYQAWNDAIAATVGQSDRGTQASEDIETLATVEWCNRWLEDQNISYRVVYITGSSRLYAAARFRWGLISSHQLPKDALSKVGRQAAHVFAYYADVLQQMDNPEISGSAKQAERYTPLRDMRYFLADPAFLTYAQKDAGEAAGNARSFADANLTEWLQAFLLRMNKEDRYIGQNFSTLAGLKIKTDPNWKRIKLESVNAGDIELFQRKWQSFLRRASFNHLIDQGIKGRTLKVLMECLSAIDTSKEDTYRLLLDYLYEAHIDVSRAATNLSIVALASKTASGQPAPMDRSVPPLVLQRFPAAQNFVSTLLQTMREPKASIIQHHLETLKNNSFDVGPDHVYTKKYLDLLLRAYCFAIFREWKGAFFLAKEAYHVTQLKVHRDCRLSDEDELSGREAAYLACIAGRHAENYGGIENFDKQCFDWIERLSDAIDAEEVLAKVRRFAIEVHQVRLASEDIAHELMYQFYSKWGDSQVKKPLKNEVIEGLNKSIETLIEHILVLKSSNTPIVQKTSQEDQELQVALHYALRQNLINLAQARFLLADVGVEFVNKISNEELAQLLTEINVICKAGSNNALHESDLHRYITALVYQAAGNLDTTRKETIRNELLLKILNQATSAWVLSYDVKKYQAILDQLKIDIL